MSWGFLKPQPVFPTKLGEKLCLMKKISESERSFSRIEVIRIEGKEKLYNISYVHVKHYPWAEPIFTRSSKPYINERQARKEFQELLKECYEKVSCEDVEYVFW